MSDKTCTIVTASGSTYVVRCGDHPYWGRGMYLTGEAEARDHEHGSTKGLAADEEYPIVSLVPWPPLLGRYLIVDYKPYPDEFPNMHRIKRTNVVRSIAYSGGEDDVGWSGRLKKLLTL